MKPILLFYVIDDGRHTTLYPTLSHVKKSLILRFRNSHGKYSSIKEMIDEKALLIVRVYGQYDHKRKCVVRYTDFVSYRALCSTGI